MNPWPFDQGPKVAAMTSAAVLAGSPVLLVVHYSDDHSWAFLEGDGFDSASSRTVSMAQVAALDESLREIADLAPGWVARRASKGAPWAREADSDV